MTTGASSQGPVLLDDRGHAAFPHVVALGDGTLLAAWRRASSHMQPDGAVWAARSDAVGAWSEPERLLSGPHDARDPCLAVLADGRLAVSWFDFDGERSTGVRLSFSDDGGRTFRHVLLPEVWGRWTAVSAPVVEHAGELLLPVYGRTGRARTSVALLASTDGGVTWALRAHLLSGRAVRDPLSEPWLVVGDAGELVCLVRSVSGRVRRLVSRDAGRTWGLPEPVFTSSSRATWTSLGDGRALAVHRSVIDSATVLRTTTDGWATWSGERVLDAAGLGTYAGIARRGPDALVVVLGSESTDRGSGRVSAHELAVPDGLRPGPS